VPVALGLLAVTPPVPPPPPVQVPAPTPAQQTQGQAQQQVQTQIQHQIQTAVQPGLVAEAERQRELERADDGPGTFLASARRPASSVSPAMLSWLVALAAGALALARQHVGGAASAPDADALKPPRRRKRRR